MAGRKALHSLRSTTLHRHPLHLIAWWLFRYFGKQVAGGATGYSCSSGSLTSSAEPCSDGDGAAD